MITAPRSAGHHWSDIHKICLIRVSKSTTLQPPEEIRVTAADFVITKVNVDWPICSSAGRRRRSMRTTPIYGRHFFTLLMYLSSAVTLVIASVISVPSEVRVQRRPDGTDVDREAKTVLRRYRALRSNAGQATARSPRNSLNSPLTGMIPVALREWPVAPVSVAMPTVARSYAPQ